MLTKYLMWLIIADPERFDFQGSLTDFQNLEHTIYQLRWHLKLGGKTKQ